MDQLRAQTDTTNTTCVGRVRASGKCAILLRRALKASDAVM